MLRVHTLGEVRLARADDTPVALRRAPLALLVHVARRAPRAVPREELAALFWGDRAEERARQSLRQALLELKQAVGDAIEVKPDAVRVQDGALALDVAEFEADARQQRLEAAAERWTGEFFPAADQLGAEFERWVDAERVALHRRLATVMQGLIGAAELASDWPAAASWAERWAAAAPLDERAHARLVEALRMDGRAAEAVERHADFVARLRAELDVDPSPEFARLATGLEAQARSESRRRTHPSVGVRTPAFVGRAGQLAELASAARAASDGTPGVVLIEDGGGCGKTRLCDELVRSLGEKPLVLRARGRAGEPWAAARELLAPLAGAPGCAGAAPEALAEVARLVPALREEFRFLPEPVGTEAALVAGVSQTLAAVSEDGLVLVILDDAHEADVESRRLLAALAPATSGRVLVVLCAEVGAREPRAELAPLLEAPGLVRLRLVRLSAPDVEAMLASMVSIPDEARARLAARIHEETRGVPVLVVELVAALVDEGLLVPDAGGGWRPSPALEHRDLPLPVPVRERVGARLARLSPSARALLDAASVLGTPVDGVLLESVAGLSPQEATAALRELSARHLLREQDGRSGSFEFVHPVAPRVAYALLSPSARQALHARAAAEMTARDMATTAERSALPFHLARAGASRASATPAGAAVVAPASTSPVVAAGSRWRGARWAALTAAAVVLAVAGVVGASRGWWAPTAEPAPGAQRIMVGAFQNRSGDPRLDRVRDVAVDWIVRGLDETGLVQIVGMGAVRNVSQAGATPASSTDEGDALRAAAREARAGTIVTGTIHQVGDSVELEAMILDARDGTLLRALPPIQASLADPRSGLERLRGVVVGAVAAMLDPSYDAGAVGARTPPNYEAYLAFMRGEDAYDRGDGAAADAEYRRAASADSAYTAPLLRLAQLWHSSGRCDRVDSLSRRLTLRPGLTRYERHTLDQVAAWCRFDGEAAHRASVQMAELAPRSQYAQFSAASSALSTNRPYEAIRRLRAVNPADGPAVAGNRYWLYQAVALHMAGEDEELRKAEQAMRAAEQGMFTLAARAYAAGALGDADRVDSAAAELFGRSRLSSYNDFVFAMIALDELRAHGGAESARMLAGRFADRAAAAVLPGAAGDTARYTRAEFLYRAGRYAEARAAAESLMVRHSGQWLVVGLIGRSAARLGDADGARRIAATLETLRTPDMRGAHIFARAQIANILGERDEAVRLLREAMRNGTTFVFDNDISHVGHAAVDLEGLESHPTFAALLKPKG